MTGRPPAGAPMDGGDGIEDTADSGQGGAGAGFVDVDAADPVAPIWDRVGTEVVAATEPGA